MDHWKKLKRDEKRWQSYSFFTGFFMGALVTVAWVAIVAHGVLSEISYVAVSVALLAPMAGAARFYSCRADAVEKELEELRRVLRLAWWRAVTGKGDEEGADG